MPQGWGGRDGAGRVVVQHGEPTARYECALDLVEDGWQFSVHVDKGLLANHMRKLSV